MNKRAILSVTTIAIMAFSCATNQKARTDGKTVPTQRAQTAVSLAESVNADRYAAADLSDAKSALATNNNSSALNAAKVAFAKAKPAYIRDKSAELVSILDQLKAGNVDKYAPEEFEKMRDQITATGKELNQGSITKAQAMLDIVRQNARMLTRNVDANLNTIRVLMERAEKVDPEVDDEAARLTALGKTAFSSGNLRGAYLNFTQALARANHSENRNAAGLSLKEIDAKMRAVQALIEDSVTLFTVDDNGNRTIPNTWSGDAFIAKNPLVAFAALPVSFDTNQPATDDGSLQWTDYSLVDTAMAQMNMDETIVQADSQSDSLYNQAIDLWQQGVLARNVGELTDAENYFDKAGEYITAYRRGAVKKIYTVKYNPTLRDCLWRIAGFSDIYEDPYLWPLLWQSNKKLVDNPDLIYPDQQLMVPAMDK